MFRCSSYFVVVVFVVVAAVDVVVVVLSKVRRPLKSYKHRRDGRWNAAARCH